MNAVLTPRTSVQYAGSVSRNAGQSAGDGPLSGVRVVELGTLIAGPFAGRVFADFGAEVVKVEQPDRGDPLRRWGLTADGTDSLWHLVQSRGKLSVTADLHDPVDQAFVRQLALQADILIENFRPGRLEGWNLDPHDLIEENPGLVVVRISGYGQSGPMRDQPAFGTIAEAAGGLRFITGEADRPPTRVGLSLGDSVASLYAVIGALVALQERVTSGRGQIVDVALSEAVLALMEGILPEYSYHGVIRERNGNIAHNSAPTNAYVCADGALVCIAANTTSLFQTLFRVLGLADYASDPSLEMNEGRVARRAELDNIITDWTRTRTSDAGIQTLRDKAVPVTRINSIADIVADSQFRDRSAFVEVEDDRLGRPLLVPGVVPRLSRTPGRVPPLAQRLGEATEEVKRRLEASAGAVAKRRAGEHGSG